MKATRRTALECALLTAALALAGCATPPPAATPGQSTPAAPTTSLQDVYADLGRAGGRVYTLDPAASAIRIYAFRAGTAAKLGHNHVLSTPSFTGFAYIPSAGVAGARFDLEFHLDQLEIDRPELRANLGAAFAAQIPPDAIASTRSHMLGADGFQADRFPLVRIRSLAMSGELPRLAARVEIELHGEKREQWVALAVDGLPERLGAKGALVLRQSDFGVKPYSVMNGLLAVQDEVVIEFSLSGS